ncbi:C3HC zinc finger-like-domain-containing protein [Mucor mucedo]|uniref:C3HC zinc finger-like-domain-containing protein n=1 Tax=Mucor mucedo TaxID=29922 RepID=UPI0022205470|nr:C3HC zinc finger-like-domain-containing protein [Mucor mucedo]KAI7897074.1 C3HC zinc finger-like-domain-containing protein [Mucor mucedo]
MISLIGSDDSIDYIELEQKTAELNAVIQKARTDANLHRLFKGKRRHSSPKRVDEDVEESLQPKKQKTNEIDAFNNRTDLMARLSTFSVLFHHIPRPLNALQCAMHGWKDTKSTVDKDPKISVLICDSCQNNMFIIDLDVTLCNEQKALEIKKKYVDGLYKCHKEDCQWHDNQCEDSLYRFPLFTISDGLEQYKSEAQHIITACLEQHQSLPDIQHPLVSQLCIWRYPHVA